MFDTQQALERGRELHRAGRLNEAEGLYRQILAVDPNHADGLHLLGVMAHQRGHHELAVDLIGKAIARNGAVADFHCNFGNALHALGRIGDAEAHYRRAITLNPAHAESYNNFGNVLNAQGRIEEAQKQFRQALALQPSYAQAHFNLANVLLLQGRSDEAIIHYQQAVGLMPLFPRAHFNLAQALQSQGKLAEAEASYRQTVALEPNWAEAHRSLGKVLRARNRPAEAEACYRRAHEIAPQASEGLLEWAELLDLLERKDEGSQVRAHLCKLAPQSARHWFELGLALQRASRPVDARDAYLRGQAIDPCYPFLRNNLAATYLDSGQPEPAIDILEDLVREGHADALSFINLGIVHQQRFDLARSVAMFEHAIGLDPNNAVAYSNYGRTLNELQRHSDARAMFERALAIDPDFVGARWNLAMSQLLQGDYAQGWLNHEARWDGSPELRGTTRGGLEQPIWQGEPLAGKTLFVWGEQGFGDALQFARYVPLIGERVQRDGGRLLYCCFDRLLPLFRRSFEGWFDVIIPHTFQPPPRYDYHCPLLSLPLRFATTLDTLPAKTPYLLPDKEKVEAWARGLLPNGVSRSAWCGREMPPTSAIHSALLDWRRMSQHSRRCAISHSIRSSSMRPSTSDRRRRTGSRSSIILAR